MISASRGIAALILGTVFALGLAGCSTSGGDSRMPQTPMKSASSLERLEKLTLAAHRCWFKSDDPAFRPYSLAPELSSFSGKPRFLLVPKGRPEAKPLLVVEGRDGSSEVATYGPVMAGALAGRVGGDIQRWNAGSGSCDA